jgi:hypothetical protein
LYRSISSGTACASALPERSMSTRNLMGAHIRTLINPQQGTKDRGGPGAFKAGSINNTSRGETP